MSALKHNYKVNIIPPYQKAQAARKRSQTGYYASEAHSEIPSSACPDEMQKGSRTSETRSQASNKTRGMTDWVPCAYRIGQKPERGKTKNNARVPKRIAY